MKGIRRRWVASKLTRRAGLRMVSGDAWALGGGREGGQKADMAP